MLQARENDLQIWFMPQIGGPMFTHRITDGKEGVYLIDAISQYDLYCHRHSLRPDFANGGGINRYERDFDTNQLEWFTYYDDETGEEPEDIYETNLFDDSHPYVLTFDTQRTYRKTVSGTASELEPLVLRFPTKSLAFAAEVALIQYQRFVFNSDSDSRVDGPDLNQDEQEG